MSKLICGECKYHKGDYITNAFNGHREVRGFKCENEQSYYYTDYTEYEDTCECFEKRGVE